MQRKPATTRVRTLERPTASPAALALLLAALVLVVLVVLPR
jgi:hypothetical protein